LRFLKGLAHQQDIVFAILDDKDETSFKHGKQNIRNAELCIDKTVWRYLPRTLVRLGLSCNSLALYGTGRAGSLFNQGLSRSVLKTSKRSERTRQFPLRFPPADSTTEHTW
jgi:hypothetical protein